MLALSRIRFGAGAPSVSQAPPRRLFLRIPLDIPK